MKRFVVGLIALAVAAPVAAQSHYVKGYVRSDGTYVQPHYQTNPDSSRYNNWSTQGNVNPYNGRAGTVNPYSTPTPTYRSPYAPKAPQVYQPYKAPCYYNCEDPE